MRDFDCFLSHPDAVTRLLGWSSSRRWQAPAAWAALGGGGGNGGRRGSFREVVMSALWVGTRWVPARGEAVQTELGTRRHLGEAGSPRERAELCCGPGRASNRRPKSQKARLEQSHLRREHSKRKQQRQRLSITECLQRPTLPFHLASESRTAPAFPNPTHTLAPVPQDPRHVSPLLCMAPSITHSVTPGTAARLP